MLTKKKYRRVRKENLGIIKGKNRYPNKMAFYVDRLGPQKKSSSNNTSLVDGGTGSVSKGIEEEEMSPHFEFTQDIPNIFYDVRQSYSSLRSSGPNSLRYLREKRLN
jgi:hypothetical protein